MTLRDDELVNDEFEYVCMACLEEDDRETVVLPLQIGAHADAHPGAASHFMLRETYEAEYGPLDDPDYLGGS